MFKVSKDSEKDKSSIEKPLKQDSARYFGGHLKYPLKSPGIFSPGESKTGIIGTLKLFQDRIEFEKQAIRKSQRWKIVIPFSAIDIEQVQFIEKDSGKALAIGGGIANPSFIGTLGIGGGLITKWGDMQLLVIPYTDENGIKHAPRFLIKGVIRDKTQEWAQIIYEKLVELNKTKFKETLETTQENDIIDKLKKLKELYEAGILTEEEYIQKKKELLDKL
jgi:hypothetical protein